MFNSSLSSPSGLKEKYNWMSSVCKWSMLLKLLMTCPSGSMWRTDPPHDKAAVSDTNSHTETEKVHQWDRTAPMKSQKCPPGVLACALMWWSAVLNAVLRSNKTKTEHSPASAAIKISFETLRRAVSVDCSLRKPSWNLSSTLCKSSVWTSCFSTTIFLKFWRRRFWNSIVLWQGEVQV